MSFPELSGALLDEDSPLVGRATGLFSWLGKGSRLMPKTNQDMMRKDIEDVMRLTDEDGNGEIDFEEFVKLLTNF